MLKERTRDKYTSIEKNLQFRKDFIERQDWDLKACHDASSAILCAVTHAIARCIMTCLVIPTLHLLLYLKHSIPHIYGPIQNIVTVPFSCSKLQIILL